MELFKSSPTMFKFLNDLVFNIFQLWKKLGAASDPFQDAGVEIDGIPKLDVLEQIKSDVIITSVDVTTAGDQIIICNEKITVTLNDTPDDQELVRVQSVVNGKLTIEGNGNTINGETNAIIRRKYTTWDILYSVELDGWIII